MTRRNCVVNHFVLEEFEINQFFLGESEIILFSAVREISLSCRQELTMGNTMKSKLRKRGTPKISNSIRMRCPRSWHELIIHGMN